MYKWIKRTLDFVFSFCLIIILAPLFIIVSIIILSIMGSPILFKQERIGLNNKPFHLYKFRSMLPKSETHSTDAERMSSFGKFLRAYRVDELPQLYNILKGDMSFIGPRPLLPKYLHYYTDFELKRHNVRPGISGLSQINKVDYPDWEVQLKGDVEYVNNISLRLDTKIFIGTIIKLCKPTEKAKLNSKPRPSFIEYRKMQAKDN